MKAKHLEGSIFMDCGSDLGSARHVPGKGITSSVYTCVLIYVCVWEKMRLIYLRHALMSFEEKINSIIIKVK